MSTHLSVRRRELQQILIRLGYNQWLKYWDRICEEINGVLHTVFNHIQSKDYQCLPTLMWAN